MKEACMCQQFGERCIAQGMEKKIERWCDGGADDATLSGGVQK
jgi:hypothetical protein